MKRRTLLSLFGLGALASVEACRSAGGDSVLGLWIDRLGIKLSDGLTDGDRILVETVADTIIPKTDTPGALDAGVPAFVEHMMASWYSVAERRSFQLGLRTLDRRCRRERGAPFPSLEPAARLACLEKFDTGRGRPGSAEDALATMKRLTIHGYLTSALVQRQVLKTEIIPGRFDGCVTEPTASAS